MIVSKSQTFCLTFYDKREKFQDKYGMEVILLNSGTLSFFGRTIGPYKVAHWLRKHNHTVQVIDFINKMDEITLYTVVKKFINHTTRILGLSFTFLASDGETHSVTYQHSNGKFNRLPEHVFNVLSLIRKENPNLKIIIGGYQSDKIPSYGIFDATIMSYTQASEEILLEYLEHLITGSNPPLSEVCFLDPDKRPWYNKVSSPKYNIEYDDFLFTEQDCVLPGEPLPLDISRGCIFACKFCQYPHLGKKKLDYIRDMYFIERELRNNYEKFGTTSYYFLDDTFNDTEYKLKLFADMVSKLPFKINYSTYLRADLIHRFPDMAHILKDSGLIGAFFGIETLHPEASKIIGKGWSGRWAREYIPKLYHDIWKKEVPTHSNFIVGITHDTEENVRGTLDWFIQNDLYGIFFQPLGLYGPDENAPIHSIKSEFDKNQKKYGYTIIPPEENMMYAEWSNNNWNRIDSTKLANELLMESREYRKLQVWFIPYALWTGLSLDYINTTPIHQYPKDFAKESERMYLKQYVNLLLNVN